MSEIKFLTDVSLYLFDLYFSKVAYQDMQQQLS